VKLARTGTEQIYMRDRPRFIETHREFERIANVNVSSIKTISAFHTRSKSFIGELLACSTR